MNFKRFLGTETVRRVQVVGELEQSRSFPNGLRIEPAKHFLAGLDFGPAEAPVPAVGSTMDLPRDNP